MKKNAVFPVLAALFLSSVSPALAFEPTTGSAMLLTLTSRPADPEARKRDAEGMLSAGIALAFMGVGVAASGAPVVIGVSVISSGWSLGTLAITRLEKAERELALEKAQNDALTYMDSGDEAPLQPLVENVREEVAALGGPEAAAQVTPAKVAQIVLEMEE